MPSYLEVTWSTHAQNQIFPANPWNHAWCKLKIPCFCNHQIFAYCLVSRAMKWGPNLLTKITNIISKILVSKIVFEKKNEHFIELLTDTQGLIFGWFDSKKLNWNFTRLILYLFIFFGGEKFISFHFGHVWKKNHNWPKYFQETFCGIKESCELCFWATFVWPLAESAPLKWRHVH